MHACKTLQGHWERPPYGPDALRSAYHVRQLEVYRLAQLDPSRTPLDVFLSHDWPSGIARHGNMQQLFRAKPFLRAEVHRPFFSTHAARPSCRQ